MYSIRILNANHCFKKGESQDTVHQNQNSNFYLSYFRFSNNSIKFDKFSSQKYLPFCSLLMHGSQTIIPGRSVTLYNIFALKGSEGARNIKIFCSHALLKIGKNRLSKNNSSFFMEYLPRFL